MSSKPENLCMAPWTHTYLSPQTERRLCCASREPAQNFKQYIDTAEGTNEYNPQTLKNIGTEKILGVFVGKCYPMKYLLNV